MEKTTHRNWRNVRADAIANGQITDAGVAEARKHLQAETRGWRLKELRQSRDMTQQEVADQLVVAQSRVSQIETGDIAISQVGTLQSYIEALGGTLRVVADFGDQQITVI